MPKITAITPQKKDKARCNIELDGQFFCGMDLEAVIGNRLSVGMEIAEEELTCARFESEKRTALDRALTHISASAKTEHEVTDFLRRKGYSQDAIDYAVGKMKGYGYLDDAAYAKAYAECAVKSKGSRLIAMELKRKGIPDEAAEAAITGLEGEEESAKRALGKYLRGKIPDRATLAKAFRYLLSKGYDYETARAALGGLADED